MKGIDIFLNKCSKQRMKYVKQKVGSQRMGFDQNGTLWMITTRPYIESFKFHKGVKYFTLQYMQNEIDFKRVDNILLFCGTKQKLWQLRLFSESTDMLKFQVICTWDMNSGKLNYTKKTECGQKLMMDFVR